MMWQGQLRAVWRHAVSVKEYDAIKSGGFPSQVGSHQCPVVSIVYLHDVPDSALEFVSDDFDALIQTCTFSQIFHFALHCHQQAPCHHSLHNSVPRYNRDLKGEVEFSTHVRCMYGLQQYFNPLLCSYKPVKKLYVFMKDSQNDPDTEFGSESVSYPAARVSM